MGGLVLRRTPRLSLYGGRHQDQLWKVSSNCKTLLDTLWKKTERIAVFHFRTDTLHIWHLLRNRLCHRDTAVKHAPEQIDSYLGWQLLTLSCLVSGLNKDPRARLKNNRATLTEFRERLSELGEYKSNRNKDSTFKVLNLERRVNERCSNTCTQFSSTTFCSSLTSVPYLYRVAKLEDMIQNVGTPRIASEGK